MTAQTTLVTFLLDRSSSMGSCLDATIEAFNGYIEGLRQATTPILFTHLQFDHNGGQCDLNKVCFEQAPSAVSNLTKATYQPRGSTPLIEAAIKTIDALRKAVTAKADKPKVVVCIQTDGEENRSGPEYTWARLKALIEELTKDGWQFNFMGAGVDAYDQQQRYHTAAAMGIMAEATMGYDSTDLHATRSAFAASSANTRSFAAGQSVNTNYSMSQRLASKDIGAKGAPLTGTLPVTAGRLPRSMRPVQSADLDLGGTSQKVDLDLTR